MSNDQTPEQGTEQETTTPQAGEETETPIETPDEDVEETPEEEQPQTEDTPQEPQQPDYKDKFKESAKEGILLNERLNVANTRIESLTKQDTPTDEAMRQLYPEWDELNDVTKKALIKQEAQDIKQRRIERQTQDILARQELDDKLDDFLDNPPDEFKKLSGNETDFRRFAKRKANVGLPLETLAKAFLFDVEDENPQPTNPQPMQEAIPTGSGGPRGDIKPKKISLEEAKVIRETDYNRYLELVKAGQIDDDID